ncbi:thaumatin-like protein 1b [Alnus glutinosa]|uniref:thaumatin-like protein 1b n=1 Tax=Alnus glutinosa TaxID=3517 RepID=UPI002D765BE1|nr:thaumatin-like protein 1b [Alnus glutinosa]
MSVLSIASLILMLFVVADARILGVYTGGQWESDHATFYGGDDASGTIGAHSVKIIVKNNCAYTIWPADVTSAAQSHLSNTGFKLASKASTSLDVPAPWNGQFWARTRCYTDGSGKFTCATADCGSGQVACNGNGGAPPVSLAEFNLAASGGQDFYDISLEDGFNLPLSITPQGGSTSCIAPSCAADVNKACPAKLRVIGSDGSVIGCNSTCIEFNQPQNCCTSTTCPPTIYSMLFKKQCPQAYSYAYDDLTSLFSCSGRPNYIVTFCP